MEPSVVVVVPVHGHWPLTERCLGSLAGQSTPHAVVVVDNASPDDTLQRLRAGWPEVTVIELGANRGFAAACNAALAGSDADLVVLLNNDVEADPDFLARLTAPLAADPGCGMVAPLLLRPGRERIDSLGIVADPTLAGYARLQGRAPRAAAAGDGRLLGPIGAAAAYRRAALDEVGGLDETIFMYGEELDLALRLRAAGWGAAAAPDAVAVHLGGASAGRGSRWPREQGGFARGYVLGRWGVLRSRMAPRALLTELVVVVADLAISRDLAAPRGRLRGWRAARGLERRRPPTDALEPSIGLLESLRRRRADYGDARLSAGAGAGAGT